MPARGRRIGVAEADVDRGGESKRDEHDQGDSGPGAPSAGAAGQGTHGAGMFAHPFLGGELLQTGSADKRFVEDEGAVLVLTAR